MHHLVLNIGDPDQIHDFMYGDGWEENSTFILEYTVKEAEALRLSEIARCKKMLRDTEDKTSEEAQDYKDKIEEYEKNDLDYFMGEYEGFYLGEGGYGYDSNPNGEFDYYLLGGRWGDVLPLKEGFDPEEVDYNEHHSEKDRKDMCCQTPVKHIDFEKLTELGKIQAEKYWVNLKTEHSNFLLYRDAHYYKDSIESVTQELNELLEVIGLDYDFLEQVTDIEKIRKKVEGKITTATEKAFPRFISLFEERYILERGKASLEYKLEDLQMSMREFHRRDYEKFLEKNLHKFIQNFAYVIKDGILYSYPDLPVGTNSVVRESEYGKNLIDILKSLDSDTLLTIYDCHS